MSNGQPSGASSPPKQLNARTLPPLVIGWSVLIAGLLYARHHGMDARIFGELTGAFGTGVGLLTFLGLTATSVHAKVRERAQSFLAGGHNVLIVAFILIVAGAALAFWSYRRVPLQLKCTPDNLTVWIGGDRTNDACTGKIWTSKSQTVFAEASGYVSSEATVQELMNQAKASSSDGPTSGGRLQVVYLRQEGRAQCQIRGEVCATR